MMCKRVLFIIVSLFFLSQTNVFATNENVLVLYDAENYYGDERDAVSSISNLLRHFDRNVVFDAISTYDESLEQYDYVMVLCFRETIINETLLINLAKYDNPILWIGKGINQLTDKSDHTIHRYGEVNNLTRVVYKNRFYDIGIKRYFEQVSVDETEYVYSYLYDGAQKYPFIMKDNNLYYVSRMDLNEPLFYIFADVLYDFFDEKVTYGSQIFIKISNVNPFTDPEALLEKATFLLERHIPFAVSVSPIYREKGSRYLTPLSERTQLVRVLQYIQENNQAIIVQGGTQFVSSNGIEGESYFDWANNQKVTDFTDEKSVEKWTEEFLNLALDECGFNNLFPIGFEGTHYVLNREAYEQIGEIFDLYIGTLQTNDWKKTVTVYPWVITNVNGLHQYVPDNLGFFSGENTSELQLLKNSLNKMEIVSEFVGGVSISPELEVRELEKLIHFLEDQQLSFYDLRQLSVEVRGENVTVFSNETQLIGESTVESTISAFASIMNIIFAVVLAGLVFVFFLFYKMFRSSKTKTDDNLF